MTIDTSKPPPRRAARGTGTLYRRKKDGVELPTWWLDYTAPGGRRIRESSGTAIKAEAVRLLKQRLGEVGTGRYVGPEAEQLTFEDLMAGIEQDYRLQDHRSLYRLQVGRAQLAHHFAGRRAVQITAAALSKYAGDRRAQGAFPATIQYELAVLRRAFSIAVRQGGLASRPAFPEMRVNNARTGFFEDAEYEAVVAQLPEALRGVVQFAYHTGWRKEEILGLTWADVDWSAGEVRIEGTETKNREARTFPFGAMPALQAMLERQRAYTDQVQRRTGRIIPTVFHREGKPVGSMYRAWRSACKRAGVPGRIFHDFRRTAVRNLERAGVARSVAMKLVGHKTESMYRRYAIVAGRDLREAGAKVAALKPAPATNVVPFPTAQATG